MKINKMALNGTTLFILSVFYSNSVFSAAEVSNSSLISNYYSYAYSLEQNCKDGARIESNFSQEQEAKLADDLKQLAEKIGKPIEDFTCKGIYEKKLIKQAELTSRAPSMLRELETGDFCVTYGNGIRGDDDFALNGKPDNFKELVKVEAKKRKLKFNDKLILESDFIIGSNTCNLLAGKGYARHKNRTVGQWGEHVQYIYKNIYIYVENGKVTSYQY